jgi:Zn-dependent protease
MDLGPEQIRWIFTYVIILIASVTFHEFGHAWVADRLGDDTPSRQGRVTLNPVAHADLIGTVLMPLAGALYSATSGGFGGFGWGRPVQTNPLRYSRRFSMATGQVFVALAGPSMNVMLAVVIAVAHVVLVQQHVVSGDSDLNKVFLFAVGMNFTLFFFNLLPVPPLDGGWVLRRFAPTRFEKQLESFYTYGPFVIMALVVIPVLAKVFTIPAQFCRDMLYQGLVALLM